MWDTAPMLQFWHPDDDLSLRAMPKLRDAAKLPHVSGCQVYLDRVFSPQVAQANQARSLPWASGRILHGMHGQTWMWGKGLTR